MTYASAIHECMTARERQRMTAVAQEVLRTNRQHAPASVSDIRNRLQAALRSQGLYDAQIHDDQLMGRVDVIVNGRTVMSWEPTLN